MLLAESVDQTRLFSSLDFKEFIYDWNLKYGYDHWWRQKYKIPFGSDQHLNMNHVWMMMEFREDRLFKALADKPKVSEQETLFQKAGVISLKRKGDKAFSPTVTDQEFENLDITQFNDKQ